MVIVCLSKANATTITNQCLLSSQPNSTQRHSFMKKAVIWRYCVKKVLAKFTEKTPASSLQIYQKEDPIEVFSRVFCEIFNNTFFYRTSGGYF